MSKGMTPVVCPSVWRGVVSSYFPQDSTPTAPGSLLFSFEEESRMLADSGRATGGVSQVQADSNTVTPVWSGLSGCFITARSGQGKSAHHSIAADAGSRERAVDTIRTHL